MRLLANMPRLHPGRTIPLVVLLAGWFMSTSARAGECEHTVSQGDTLSRIAARNGVAERDLIETNPALAANPDMLRLGQKLDLCAAKQRTKTTASGAETSAAKGPRCGRGGRIVGHEVKSGETLSKIAGHYSVPEDDITKYNPKLRERPDLLRVGQEVKICVQAARARNHKVCDFKTPLFGHEVVPGEHLAQIAGRYGVRRGDLVRWNPRLRKNPDMLSVGQKINVCPEIAPRERSRISYTVQSGDTLGDIAQKYGLSPRELERYQRGKLTDRNALREGQTLTVWVDGAEVRGFGGRNTDRGVLSGGIQLPNGRHYHVKREHSAWGTSHTVRSIQTAVATYKRKMPGGPKVHVGDISRKAGGPFSPHISHQHGRDVDMGYVLAGQYAHETKFRTVSAKYLDVPRTWTLIKAFLDTNEVAYIFMDYRIQGQLYDYARERGVNEDTLDELFQYPRGRGRTHGMIRHWRGHVNHFHVRFRR